MGCFDIIESRHRHDFVKCKCGKSFIDGGDDYLRGGGYLVPILDAMDEDMFDDDSFLDDDLGGYNLGYQAGTLDERERILRGLQKLEDQSNATKTPLYQETMFAKIREIAHASVTGWQNNH